MCRSGGASACGGQKFPVSLVPCQGLSFPPKRRNPGVQTPRTWPKPGASQRAGLGDSIREGSQKPLAWLQANAPAPQSEVFKRWAGVAMPRFQLASASPPPGCCPPQRSPYCHTGPATWPVISGQGEGEVKPDWGCVCVHGRSPDQSSGAGHTLWAALLQAQPRPPPTPLTTSPSPRTGQALATPRLHPMGSEKGEVVLTAPPVQLSPFSHRKPGP